MIRDGIRRAVASHRVGRTVVRACLLHTSRRRGPVHDVLLSQLLSPTDTLDLLADPQALIRFRKLENAAWRGVILPAIIIVPGSQGFPIAGVRIIQ
jgi:hypothetical protein